MKPNYLVILPHQRTSTVSLKKFLFGWSEVNMIRQITSEQANYAARVKSDNPFVVRQANKIRGLGKLVAIRLVFSFITVHPFDHLPKLTFDGRT